MRQDDRYDVEVLYGDPKQATVLKNPCLKESKVNKSDRSSFRVMLTLIVLAALVFLFLYLRAAKPAQVKTTVVGGCDESLWARTYNPERLKINARCVTVIGVIADATNGKRKDGVRHEADGDCHGWLRLDAGQEKYLNAGNVNDEGGNLVFEIVHLYKATQKDAVASGVGYTNKVKLPRVGSHVKITGAWVTDTNHAQWNEIHPVTRIEVVK